MRTKVGQTTRAYVTAFGEREAVEQRERAMAMFEQLTVGSDDMSWGQCALVIDLMLAFARAEIMRLESREGGRS
jgi:hypothetical protein